MYIVMSKAINVFKPTKIGNIELRLHTNTSVFPSVKIICILDALSKAKKK